MVRVAEAAGEEKRRVRTVIHGAVQGVGFRPFIFRLAKELSLTGWITNTPQGVMIEAEGNGTQLQQFLSSIHSEKPPRASIYSCESTFLDTVGYTEFIIKESTVDGIKSAFILPDIATCPDCQREIFDPTNRRYLYPFTNCTNCGPRYSIIKSLPYDRKNTTMSRFTMCPECAKEYHDPNDRRFHAQPNACPQCGPHIEAWDAKGNILATHHAALKFIADELRNGKIVAFKGLGGFQLLVDATNEEAVQRLRARKHREEKPFALMFPSLEMTKKYCEVSEIEKRLLLSPESPIVLLHQASNIQHPASKIAASIAPHNPYLGAMLPYTPLHHLLMREIDFPIVATSGNISDEPICIDEHDALNKLGAIADLFLVHNRPIQRYVDDSIVRVVLNREMVMRRARGFAPLPIISKLSTEESVLAVGGHLKNTIAIQKQNMVFVSQHIGDLETVPALECFKNTISDITSLYEVQPNIVIHDKHPNYFSTTIAQQMESSKESYQHHFAHIASCMAENELNEPLFGVSWDGTGYGLDGTIWGGEFVEFDGREFSRFATIRSFQLPGGDAAVKESIRSAAGMLYEMFGAEAFHHPVLKEKFSTREAQLIAQMMEKKINSPRITSMGRMFDAVGAILGLRDRSSFEGQTAMEVEFAAQMNNTTEHYPVLLTPSNTTHWMIDWKPMMNCLLSDLEESTVNLIARKFHNTLVEMIIAAAEHSPYRKVLLSGGCFQNALLLELSVKRLREEGYEPYWHQRIPTNDGGISVGQVYMHQLRTVSSFKHYVSSEMIEEQTSEA